MTEGYKDLVDHLEEDFPDPTSEGYTPPPPSEPTSWKEVVVDSKTGRPRQAGTTSPEGKFIEDFRALCERDLYVFSKGVIGRRYFTKDLHLSMCRFVQGTPPFRKLLLVPRLHAKTSIASHCLPPHILIQRPETNVYFPGEPGSSARILLAGETEGRAKGNLGVIRRGILQNNDVFRALWPNAYWERPKRDAPEWSSVAITIPREIDFPDPSIRAIGVGGAITGARPTIIIKDDLISLEAANSDIVMQGAIEWHKVSRALLEEYEKDSGLEGLEILVGTRWAIWDLYQHIVDNDPTVEVMTRSILETDEEGNPHPIWPERFNQARVDHLREEYGSLFWLLYMNQPHNPDLVDFDLDQLRYFEVQGEQLVFDEDDRDAVLREKVERGELDLAPVLKGTPLNASTWDRFTGGRGEYFRLKRG